MRRACRQVEPLLARAASTLGDKERGTLAQHLRGCADCRSRDQLVTALIAPARAPAQLSQTARERAISRAFASVEAAPAPAPAPSPKRAIGLTFAVAAAAVAVVGLRLSLMEPPATPLPRVAEATPTAVAPVTSVVAVNDDAVVPAPEDEAPYEAKTSERRAFAGAEVTLAAGSTVRFRKAASTVEVARGEVSFEVEKRTSTPFVVTTQSFRVEVLGTQFSVSPERVSVAHGRVAVRTVGGETLLAELGAGESYVHRDGGRARASDRAVESVARLLDRAREALGQTNVALARTLLAEVAERRPPRREQAEADTLQAECALLEHDAPRALRAYLDVAHRFADLAAGENAAFAAAQLSTRVHGDEEARALYQRYIARYPRGRFADEARAHLSAPHAQ